MFNLVKIKNSKDIFGSSKCKVTFGFKYISKFINVLLTESILNSVNVPFTESILLCIINSNYAPLREFRSCIINSFKEHLTECILILYYIIS